MHRLRWSPDFLSVWNEGVLFPCHFFHVFRLLSLLLQLMVLSGIPHRLRPHIWLRSTNAAALCADCPLRYDELVACAAFELEGARQQIEVSGNSRLVWAKKSVGAL